MPAIFHLVMGPKTPGTPVRFRVLIDGQAPGASHGSDVDEHGYGSVSQQRLFQLIRQSGLIADRQFEIEFLDPDVKPLRSRSADPQRAPMESYPKLANRRSAACKS